MRHKNRQTFDGEPSYWLSYSDMMAALLLAFVLIISFTVLQSRQSYEQKEERLDEEYASLLDLSTRLETQHERLENIIGVRSELIDALQEEFGDSDLDVSVDGQTGTITFNANILFDFDSFELTEEGRDHLVRFLPRYFDVLTAPEFKPYLSEIVIEGHTDTVGEYLPNLYLSQRRALTVADFCLQKESSLSSGERLSFLRSVVTASGRSFANPILNEDGSVNMDASRRVEFKFRLNDEDMVREMAEVLREE